MECRDPVEGFLAVSGFSHDLIAEAVENCPHAHPDQGLVIDKENTPVRLRHMPPFPPSFAATSLSRHDRVCGIQMQNSRENDEAPATEQGLRGPSKCYHGAAASIKMTGIGWMPSGAGAPLAGSADAYRWR
jgi:hypothetical protein